MTNDLQKTSLEWLRRKYDSIDISQLPVIQGIPMSLEESDYKTYYTIRLNESFKKNSSKHKEEVYLISDNISTVKIGISKDVAKRFRSIEMASGRKLTLVATYFPTSISYKKLERELFKKYSDYRRIGEWFDMLLTRGEFISVCQELDYLQ